MRPGARSSPIRGSALAALSFATLAGCFSGPLLERFPDRPLGSEIDPALAQLRDAVTRECPTVEVLRVAPTTGFWVAKRVNGSVVRRTATLNVGIRRGSQCYLFQPIVAQEFMGDTWGAPTIVDELNPRGAQIGVNAWEVVEHRWMQPFASCAVVGANP